MLLWFPPPLRPFYCYPAMSTRVCVCWNTHSYTEPSKAALLISSRISEHAGGLEWLFKFPYMGIFVSVALWWFMFCSRLGLEPFCSFFIKKTVVFSWYNCQMISIKVILRLFPLLPALTCALVGRREGKSKLGHRGASQTVGWTCPVIF